MPLPLCGTLLHKSQSAFLVVSNKAHRSKRSSVLPPQVTAREQARPIGMLVLRKAAWDRQREESLAQQRRRLAQELPNISDVESAASAFAKPLPIHSAGEHWDCPSEYPEPSPRKCATGIFRQMPFDIMHFKIMNYRDRKATLSTSERFQQQSKRGLRGWPGSS